MTPARGLSFLRFSRPPHQPHLPPHFPTPSSRFYSGISHPAPLFPHKCSVCFPPGHGFLPSHFPTQKARRHPASGPVFSYLKTPAEPLAPALLFSPPAPSPAPLPRPFQPFLFRDFPPRANFPPQMPSMLPTRLRFPPIPFPHTKSPEASRLRADISHVCPSLGTSFLAAGPPSTA